MSTPRWDQDPDYFDKARLRLVASVKVDDTTGCWIWQRSFSGASQRYAQFGNFKSRKNNYAHRVSWELANGRPVAPGLAVDHLCRVPACVNPDHLEEVTRGENMQRARTGLCGAGLHSMDDPANVTNAGSCRACWNRYMREYRAKKNAA